MRLIFPFIATLIAAGCAGTDSPSDAGLDGSVSQDAGPGADGGGADAGQVACDPNAPPALAEIRAAGGAFYTNPHWSADGTRVAVLAWNGFSLSDAIVVNRCGEMLRSLSVGSELKAVSNYGPAFDSVGRIYFSTMADEIKRVPETGAAELIVSNTVQSSFDVTSDGNFVVFVGGTGLSVRDVAGSSTLPLGVSGSSARFSPDGLRIAYLGDSRLNVIGRDATNPDDVYTFADNLEAGSVDWLPNGDFIVTTRIGVERISADGLTRTMLVAEPLARDVDVSPDGMRIVYGMNGRPQVVLRSL